MLYTLFSWTIILMQIAMFSAIVYRLRKAEDASGIDVGGECLVASMGIVWVVYGFGIGEIPVWLTGALGVVGCGSVVYSKIRAEGLGKHWVRAVSFSTPVLVTILVLWVLLGYTAIGVLVTAGSVVQYLPQLVYSAKDIALRRPAVGVSVFGSGVRCVYHGMWLGYGFLVTPMNVPVIVYAAMGVITFGAQTMAAVRSKQAHLKADDLTN